MTKSRVNEKRRIVRERKLYLRGSGYTYTSASGASPWPLSSELHAWQYRRGLAYARRKSEKADARRESPQSRLSIITRVLCCLTLTQLLSNNGRHLGPAEHQKEGDASASHNATLPTLRAPSINGYTRLVAALFGAVPVASSLYCKREKPASNVPGFRCADFFGNAFHLDRSIPVLPARPCKPAEHIFCFVLATWINREK